MFTATSIIAAAIAFQPGDGIVSVRMSLFPIACSVHFIDEGQDIHASGYGQPGLALYSEARRMIQDASPQPGTVSPIQECVRAAQATCGAAGVKSVTVTANPDSCSFECYPPSTGPKPPTAPPATPPLGAGGRD